MPVSFIQDNIWSEGEALLIKWNYCNYRLMWFVFESDWRCPFCSLVFNLPNLRAVISLFPFGLFLHHLSNGCTIYSVLTSSLFKHWAQIDEPWWEGKALIKWSIIAVRAGITCSLITTPCLPSQVRPGSPERGRSQGWTTTLFPLRSSSLWRSLECCSRAESSKVRQKNRDFFFFMFTKQQHPF